MSNNIENKNSHEQLPQQLTDLIKSQSPENQNLINQMHGKLEKNNVPKLTENITATLVLLQNIEKQTNPKLQNLGKKILELTDIPPIFLASKDWDWYSILNSYLLELKKNNVIDKKIWEINEKWMLGTNDKLKSFYWKFTNQTYDPNTSPNFVVLDPKTQKSPADLALTDLISPSPEKNINEILEEIQENKEIASETVSKTLEAQTNLKSQFPELSEPDTAQQDEIIKSLNLPNVKNKQEFDNEFATNQKFENYRQAWLKSDNLLSFLHTQSQIENSIELQNKVKQSKDYQAFDQNFQTIQNDLHLAPTFKGKSADKLGNGMTSETVPVKDLRNIDNHSIGQIKGIESYSGTPQSPDTYRNLPTEGINLQNPVFDKAEKIKIFDSRQIDASEQTSMAFLNTQNANFKDFERCYQPRQPRCPFQNPWRSIQKSGK